MSSKDDSRVSVGRCRCTSRCATVCGGIGACIRVRISGRGCSLGPASSGAIGIGVDFDVRGRRRLGREISVRAEDDIGDDGDKDDQCTNDKCEGTRAATAGFGGVIVVFNSAVGHFAVSEFVSFDHTTGRRPVLFHAAARDPAAFMVLSPVTQELWQGVTRFGDILSIRAESPPGSCVSVIGPTKCGGTIFRRSSTRPATQEAKA